MEKTTQSDIIKTALENVRSMVDANTVIGTPINTESGTTIIKVRKELSNKTLIAKKDGYKNTPVTLDATLNPVSIINLTNILAWAIDLGTGKCCKWDTDVVEIEMEKSKTEN